jgi:thiamine biosynthesis protein ThiI
LHGLILISGGIDSPVAAALMLQQKIKLSSVFFDAHPFADKEQLDKVKMLVDHLQNIFKTEIPLYQVPHAKNLTEIGRNCSEKSTCVLCRRMMLLIASELGKSKGMDILITGESLGQVASQTLSNLLVENSASSLLVVRPLIGLDKIEIEKKAQMFGTYQISIMPGMCCTMAPKYPLTYGNLDKIKDEELKLNLMFLVNYALENTKLIKN